MPIIKSTWHHIRRSPFQSLIAFLVVSLTFFVISSFIIVSQGLQNVLNYFETKPEITIFLKDGLDLSTVEKLNDELSQYPNIREIKFISKEKALTIYQEQNKDNPLLTEMVTASILPASFEVSVSDPAVLEQISIDFSKKTNEVDETIYQKDIIDSLLSWTNLVRRSGIVAISVFTSISILIIFVIVGMKITNRKEEIRISRLLGASKFYVKRPFLLEGVLYGAVGGFIGSVACLSLALYFQSTINQFFQPISFLSTSPLYYLLILVSLVFTSALIGFISSWIGVKRYIKF
jgi:cell division transport system permease protein